MILRLPYRDGKTLKLVISDVLYVPNLGLNLLSCSRLAMRGVASVLNKYECTLIDKNDNDDVPTHARLRDNLYWIENATPQLIPEVANPASTHHASTIDVNIWHNRLSYVAKDKIASTLRAKQLPRLSQTDEIPCPDCSLGKQARDAFGGHIDKATKAGDVIHSDVVGPLPASLSGSRYFVSFIDEWTRFVTVTPMTAKSEVLTCFKEFKVMFENQYDTTIKSVHSDNGVEYAPVEQYAKARGIAVTRSAPYTPQSNGIAERMNRTLVEAVRTTLAQSGLPKVFSAESLANAVMVRNRMPRDNDVSPYEQISGHQPTLERYRPFGCLGMVHLDESKRKKLDAKTIPCVLLRTIDHRTYRMYDIAKGQVVMTRHVTFDESKFPAKEQPTSLNDSDEQISSETPSEHNADNESVYGNPGSDSSGTPEVEEAESVNSDTSEDNASVSDEAASQAENETSTNCRRN
jgi:Integrase core domain/GAG-pre-integrase domain